MSPNGLLVNSNFIQSSDGDCVLRHGDIIAFSASNAATRVAGAVKDKPFIAFVFKEHSQERIAARQDKDVELAEGLTSGRWWSSELSLDVPDAAVAGLEAFGENVCMQLPMEARQIFLCHEMTLPVNGSLAMPNLRIGQQHQRKFWRLVLEPDFYAEGSWPFLAADHFDIVPVMLGDDGGGDMPSELLFKMHVLSTSGVTLNRSMHLVCGEEHGLREGDIVTVGALHFMFRPFRQLSKLQDIPEAEHVVRVARRRANRLWNPPGRASWWHPDRAY
jgi:hypothetical protein